MRILLLVLALAVLALGAPSAARADCARVAKDLCATENGHYRIRTPDGLGPHPTVLYLYGSTGQSGQIINRRAFEDAFVSRGYAVIVPAALDLRYADGLDSGWFLRHERGKKERDEVAFVAEVLRDAEQNFVIDRRNVLMTGMSRGAFLTWEIACHHPDMAKAYAPVAGGYLGPMPDRCRAPVKLMHTHGTADKIVPYQSDKPWGSGGARAQPLEVALGRMASTGGCERQGKTTPFLDYERTVWENCNRSASVDLLVHKGGHTIPRSWYPAVIDWYEKGSAPKPSPVVEATGGTAVFKGASTGTRLGKRAPSDGVRVLRGGSQSSGGTRFKKVPGTQ
ncbi:MAG: hypothetical protein AAGH68_10270 [Pseudomonadota bacterium]